jgi:hypothetical protein
VCRVTANQSQYRDLLCVCVCVIEGFREAREREVSDFVLDIGRPICLVSL